VKKSCFCATPPHDDTYKKKEEKEMLEEAQHR
jgi:hypothetical protein